MQDALIVLIVKFATIGIWILFVLKNYANSYQTIIVHK